MEKSFNEAFNELSRRITAATPAQLAEIRRAVEKFRSRLPAMTYKRLEARLEAVEEEWG